MDKMLSKIEGSTGYLIFNNPEKHNAVSLEMWDATDAILDEFESNRRCTRRCIDRSRRKIIS